MKCSSCKFYTEEKFDRGTCSRWLYGYDFRPGENEKDRLPKNEVIVENDEGWGAMMGPDFGCVLFEKKPMVYL